MKCKIAQCRSICPLVCDRGYRLRGNINSVQVGVLVCDRTETKTVVKGARDAASHGRGEGVGEQKGPAQTLPVNGQTLLIGEESKTERERTVNDCQRRKQKWESLREIHSEKNCNCDLKNVHVFFKVWWRQGMRDVTACARPCHTSPPSALSYLPAPLYLLPPFAALLYLFIPTTSSSHSQGLVGWSKRHCFLLC